MNNLIFLYLLAIVNGGEIPYYACSDYTPYNCDPCMCILCGDSIPQNSSDGTTTPQSAVCINKDDPCSNVIEIDTQCLRQFYAITFVLAIIALFCCVLWCIAQCAKRRGYMPIRAYRMVPLSRKFDA